MRLKKIKYLLPLTTIFLLTFCQTKTADSEELEEKPLVKKERPSALNDGKFFEANGEQMLYGGPDSVQHFNISNYDLKDEQFHYGIGREVFPALLEPLFITVKEADSLWNDDDRFLIAYKGDDVKAYSVKDLTRHEVVNDMLDDTPIMAAYCILADLGAIYERSYGGEELTFALSGYTYYDSTVWNGLDGFVFWDRETESLWWPLIGKAVSGPLQGVKLLEMNKVNWKDTNWGDVRTNYPSASILASGQDFERPQKWERKVDASLIVSNFSK